MSKRTDDLHAKVEALRAELADLGAIEEPSEDEIARSDAALAEYDTTLAEFEASRARDEKIDAIRTASLDPKNVENPFHAPNVVVRGKRDPWANMDAVRAGLVSPDEIIARAVEGVSEDRTRGVSDDARESALNLIEEGGANMAAYALSVGSPAYRSAFDKYLQHPMQWQSMLSGEESDAVRTAMSNTAANGGYALPLLLDPSVILSSSGSTNPFRQVSRIVRGTAATWKGLSSAGVTAYWKGEGSAFTDGSPTLGQPSISAVLGSAYVLGSYEVFEDTNLASELPALIQDAKDQLEADAFAVGSGSTAPKGVVTAVTAVTASRVSPTTGGSFTSASVADVYKVVNALAPRYRGGSTWLSNYQTYNIIRQMGATYGSSFWTELGGDQPARLLGLPVIESSAVVSTVTTGSNILLCGDFSQFIVFDRIGTSIEYMPNVVDGSGVPTGQRGWVAHWRTGSDVGTATAFIVLKL